MGAPHALSNRVRHQELEEEGCTGIEEGGMTEEASRCHATSAALTLWPAVQIDLQKVDEVTRSREDTAADGRLAVILCSIDYCWSDHSRGTAPRSSGGDFGGNSSRSRRSIRKGGVDVCRLVKAKLPAPAPNQDVGGLRSLGRSGGSVGGSVASGSRRLRGGNSRDGSGSRSCSRSCGGCRGRCSSSTAPLTHVFDDCRERGE